MGEREAQLHALRAKQNKWFSERQAEKDREKVVSELRADSLGGPGPFYSSGSPSSASRNRAASYSNASPSTSAGGGYRDAPPAASSGGRSAQQQPPGGARAVPPVAASYDYAGNGSGQQQHWQQQQQQQQQQLGWSGNIRPEVVIDKLTERIADRLRSELKMELQKESETLQQRVAHENLEMDDFLAKELETQNTCPICYELMVPPNHAPQLLFPCGHTFCSSCINSHVDRHKKNHCPICRKQIDSRAPNYSLQQLILNFVNKKNRMQSPVVASVAQSMELSRSQPFSPGVGDDESLSERDRLRRQSTRIQIRLTVLENELTDTITEHRALEGRATAARLVLDHMKAEEQGVVIKMQALQAELELLRGQMGVQQQKFDQAAEEAAAVLSRRQMLVDTIEPLRGELQKVEMVVKGLNELEHR